VYNVVAPFAVPVQMRVVETRGKQRYQSFPVRRHIPLAGLEMVLRDYEALRWRRNELRSLVSWIVRRQQEEHVPVDTGDVTEESLEQWSEALGVIG